MALSGPALLTRNPAHSQIQSHNRRDIHGVVSTFETCDLVYMQE